MRFTTPTRSKPKRPSGISTPLIQSVKKPLIGAVFVESAHSLVGILKKHIFSIFALCPFGGNAYFCGINRCQRLPCMQLLHGTGNGGAVPKGQRQSENRFLSYRKRFLSMRKLLDLKAGAIFHEEMDRITLCVRKECMEIIYKLKPGRFMIINMIRSDDDEVLLMTNWGNFFSRMQNPDVQLPKIKQCCPTLHAVLTGEDPDEVFRTSCGKSSSPDHVHGLALTCKTDPRAPLIGCITDPLLHKVTTLVNKNIAIYNELSSNPPFPAWKDGLMEVWNG